MAGYRKVEIEYLKSNIKYIRKKNKLTQKEFAQKISVPFSQISDWEHGKKLPSATSLATISKRFNINLDNLVFDNFLSSDVTPKEKERPRPEKKIYGLYRSAMCCPKCHRLRENGNDGRFCKYCGQEIEGMRNYGENVAPFDAWEYDRESI